MIAKAIVESTVLAYKLQMFAADYFTEYLPCAAKTPVTKSGTPRTSCSNLRTTYSKYLTLHGLPISYSVWPRRESATALVQRILARLAEAEQQEGDPWFKADYFVAHQTVRYAAQGVECPWELAFAMHYGQHPLRLIPEFRNREWLYWRYALKCQGPEPDVWGVEDSCRVVSPTNEAISANNSLGQLRHQERGISLQELPPRKQPVSVRLTKERAA